MAALLDAFSFVQLRASGLEVAGMSSRSHHEQVQQNLLDPSLSKHWQASKLVIPTWEGGEAIPQLSKQQQAQLKALVRKGVPFNLRPAVWLVASGGLAKAKAAPAGQYASLAASAGSLPSLVLGQVDADVRTVCLTWRQHALLKSAAGIQAMSRILVALLNHNPNLGYSRQLCHMVAFCMVVFGGPAQQEQVFWTLAALLEDKLYGYCQGQWVLGSRVEQEVLSKLAARKLPRLAAHLASMRLPISSFTQPWLAGLFVPCLPPETLARVWDCMMVEGSKLLLRVGLALLKIYEQTLSSCTFPEVLRKVLELRVSRTTDAGALLSAALKGCGSLPGEQVQALRAEVLKGLAGRSSEGGAQGQQRISPFSGASTSPTASTNNSGSNSGTVGSAPTSGSGTGGGVISSLLHRSASGPKLGQTSPGSGNGASSSRLGSSAGPSSPVGSPGSNSPPRSSNGGAAGAKLQTSASINIASLARSNLPVPAVVPEHPALETTPSMSMSDGAVAHEVGSNSSRGGSPQHQRTSNEKAASANGAAGAAAMAGKKGSVSAHLSHLVSRLGLFGGAQRVGGPAATADSGHNPNLSRSATTSNMRALAAF